MQRIKTFNLVKNAAWNCILLEKTDGVEKDEQKVNLTLLRDLMLELKVYIDFYEITRR